MSGLHPESGVSWAGMDGAALFVHAMHRDAPVPWHAQVPSDAVARMFPAHEGWERLSRLLNSTLNSMIGDEPPQDRTHTLSFYAYARPGLSVALIHDAFLLDDHKGAPGRAHKLVYWPSLHPDKRRRMLSETFDAAVVAPSPVSLLAAVRERVHYDPDPVVRDIWRNRSDRLLEDLMDHPALDEREHDTLTTMTALGAFEAPAS